MKTKIHMIVFETDSSENYLQRILTSADEISVPSQSASYSIQRAAENLFVVKEVDSELSKAFLVRIVDEKIWTPAELNDLFFRILAGEGLAFSVQNKIFDCLREMQEALRSQESS